jgi:hypothetical protein
MKFPTWKMVLYLLIGLCLVAVFILYYKIAYLALAPAGFIIYFVESLHILKKVPKWKSISGKEKWDVILTLIVLLVIAVIIVMILSIFADSLKDL